MATLSMKPSPALHPLIPLEEQLFGRTFRHPILGPLVSWVPTSWLLRISNPTPSPVTDLGNWSKEELVDWDALFENIKNNGMRDPFLVGVGRVSRRVRLEAGNQRVQCCLLRGILRVPAVAYVGDGAITHLGNGTHEGQLAELKLPMLPPEHDIMGPYPLKTYHRLEDVLGRVPSH